MSNADHIDISQHSGIDFVFRADHDIYQAQYRTEGYAEGTLIIPLIGTVIDIQHDSHAHPLRHLSSKKRCTAARLFAQTGSGNHQDMTVSERCCQHIINGQFDIGTVIAVIGEREAIWRLDTQNNCAGAVPWFVWDKLCFYSFTA